MAANTIIDGKGQTVYTTTSDKTTHFMSPIGSLQLTAEECNEILMKRAVAAVQQQNQQHGIATSTASDVHNAREFTNKKKNNNMKENSVKNSLTYLCIYMWCR